MVIIYGDVVTPEIVLLTVPSEYIKVHGAVPVKFTFIVEETPEHIDPPPLMVAVGIGFTVTVPVPELLQPFSVYVTEYDVVEVGLIEIV